MQLARYIWRQSVSWESVGETLNYETIMDGRYQIRVLSVDESGADLAVTLTHLRGSHTGPGVEYHINSDLPLKESGINDRMLGPSLIALNKELRLRYDNGLGTIVSCTGGDQIVSHINRQYPPQSPTLPAPLAKQAEQRFGNHAQQRQWAMILQAPRVQMTETRPIGGALIGDWNWQWQAPTNNTLNGAAYPYAISLPASDNGTSSPAIRIPLPSQRNHILLDVISLNGEGKLTLQDGQFISHEQQLNYTVSGKAHSQTVTQQHNLHWAFGFLTRERSNAESSPTENTENIEGIESIEGESP